MKKFFVPSKWEKNSDGLKFTTIKGNLTGGAPATSQKAEQQKTKKNKNIKGKKDKNDEQKKGKGPLTPASPTTTPKIKNGRIEKKKNKQQIKQKKLQLKPANAKAAEESLNEVSKGPLAPPSLSVTPKVKSGRVEKKKKKQEQKQNKIQMTPAHAKVFAKSLNKFCSSAADSIPASQLQAKLKEQLKGGRFRFINEQLYTIDSVHAQQLFQQDQDAFGAYHEGYRHQVEKWPLNPLNRIIKTIRKLPRSLEIGDFGCGEGKLAKSVPHKVNSMDLVSCRDDIIACDMANTPLPTQSLDVAVYCLSLMGTNLNDYLLEANRVLKVGGFVYIAEIQSRFDDVYAFVKCLESCGFELVKKDVSVKLFYFFHFKKVRNVGKVVRLQPFSLKPCMYKKR